MMKGKDEQSFAVALREMNAEYADKQRMTLNIQRRQDVTRTPRNHDYALLKPAELLVKYTFLGDPEAVSKS